MKLDSHLQIGAIYTAGSFVTQRSNILQDIWKQHRTNKTVNKVTNTYNQIDYIIFCLDQKRTLINTTSFACAFVNSHNRSVNFETSISPFLLFQHNKKRQDKPIDYSYIDNSDVKEAYQTDLRQKLEKNNDEGERPSLQQK